MIAVSGEIGIDVMVDLCQGVLDGRGMPDDWVLSALLPIFKGKGDAMSCQGSVLSPLVFVIVVDMVTENVRNGLMSEMLYVDDLVLTSETMEGLREKSGNGRRHIGSKGLKVNLRKTKVVVSGAEGEVSVS